MQGKRVLMVGDRCDDMQGARNCGLDAAAVCLTDALQALFDLTGENASDATIEEVFETFCVGK